MYPEYEKRLHEIVPNENIQIEETVSELRGCSQTHKHTNALTKP